jgi:NAD(P)-dependent dehydrogenase (short-subunit alcohol dehydrogenase family)
VGEVDIVVNNAGYFPNRSIDELDLATWRKTFANLDSHFLSVKYFLPAMRKRKWGRFVGISSNMVGLAIPGYELLHLFGPKGFGVYLQS